MLNQRNAAVAPIITPQNAASMSSPCAYAIAPNPKNAMMTSPPASPSRPSVMLTELADAMMIKMNNGMYHQPIEKSPIPGKWN